MTNIPEIAGAVALLIMAVALAVAFIARVVERSRAKSRDKLVEAIERGLAAQMASALTYVAWWGCGSGVNSDQSHLEATPQETALVISRHLYEHGCIPSGQRFREDLRAVVKERKAGV